MKHDVEYSIENSNQCGPGIFAYWHVWGGGSDSRQRQLGRRSVSQLCLQELGRARCNLRFYL